MIGAGMDSQLSIVRLGFDIGDDAFPGFPGRDIFNLV
jgi:hypothetical protein